MDMELRRHKKRPGFIRFLNSFMYSWEGLVYAVRNEQSITIMIIVTIAAVLGALYFKLTEVEWLFIVFSIGIVLATELINTSIEATIDLVSPQHHPLAKIAKDTGSAAVFVFSIIAFAIACIIFVPHILKLFGL